MIAANHTWFFVRFFNFYTKRILKKHFHRIFLNVEEDNYNKPLLVVGNHFSWFDGFIGLYVNEKVFKKRFYVMMLSAQLKFRMFLNKAGAFGIEKGNRDVSEALDYASRLMQNPQNMLLMFPQGKIEMQYQYPLHFEKGAYHLLENNRDTIQLVFLSSVTDYGSYKKPTLYIKIATSDSMVITAPKILEDAYNQFHYEHINSREIV
ncbi:MAG: lysophospholipid acyltransferase family protein [Bacteroidales bacterium]|nr:lysophospholipid acyltransferase family protein [Bacteroidales bacterium]